ncbi:MAG: addiction module protein [Magnetococcales bacterium]|nr:addiction module protein [Magnetococcales bacterium]
MAEKDYRALLVMQDPEAVARLEWVDAILSSLDEPNQEMDRLWSQESEERLAACRRGEMKATPLAEVLAKYRTPLLKSGCGLRVFGVDFKSRLSKPPG